MGLREALWLSRHPLSSPPTSEKEVAAEERENAYWARPGLRDADELGDEGEEAPPDPAP